MLGVPGPHTLKLKAIADNCEPATLDIVVWTNNGRLWMQEDGKGDRPTIETGDQVMRLEEAARFAMEQCRHAPAAKVAFAPVNGRQDPVRWFAGWLMDGGKTVIFGIQWIDGMAEDTPRDIVKPSYRKGLDWNDNNFVLMPNGRNVFPEFSRLGIRRKDVLGRIAVLKARSDAE